MMTLQPADDLSVADWLVQSPTNWQQLVGFGPAGFEEYVRLRFIPDPVRADEAESEVELAEDHPTDYQQTRSALEILRSFTTTPDELYFCLWEGSGFDLPPSICRPPLIEAPHRSYFLASGSYADFDSWETFFADGWAPLPAFIWPADRAWCFAKDVDPHWAGIGGIRGAMASMLDSSLDVATAAPSTDPPTYY